MGNKWSHNQSHRLGQVMYCPNCNRQFSAHTMQSSLQAHLDSCYQNQQVQVQAQNPFHLQNLGDNYVWMKTNGQWNRVKFVVQGGLIQDYTPQQIGKCSFPEKQVWLRMQLEKKRIPWQLGSDKMNIDLNALLETSLQGVQKVNMFKEVKLELKNDKVQDAGGLLREWLTLIFKEMCNTIFTLTETESVSYKISKKSEYFTLVGAAIGKALFERMPLNMEFDRPLIKLLLGQEVVLDDIAHFDKHLYSSWTYMLQNTFNPDDLQQYFIICHDQECIELKQNGADILVNNDNKLEYVKLCIKYFTQDLIQTQVQQIQSQMYKIIPKEYLGIFSVDEFEMILYGLPFINLQEWKEQTIYELPYTENHQIIKWFWQVLMEFDNDQLKKFLHYCTGSYRIPINGFSKLESNRGQYSKFKIVPIAYKDANSYPIAHTCFNRLELPKYPNEQTIRKFIRSIVLSDLEGVFGIE